MERELIPVLLGADLNCYNVARAFHEQYNVISYAFGRYPIGVTEHSRIIRFTMVEKLDDPDVLVETLTGFAEKHQNADLLLMGCTDEYVSMIIREKDRLPRFIIPYIDRCLMEDITLKEHFYGYCERMDMPYPKTVIYKKGDELLLPFDYPIIIKPSSSVLYWKYPFEGMKKVYRATDREEAMRIINEIYASGYPDKLIVQDMIPGDDSGMYTMTAYCGTDHKVHMMCLGHVLLEEHTPKGLGNHAAIITASNPALAETLKHFLEEIGYVGYANFDIKYDPRDGRMKLFEINVRQGRSNYYVTAAGCNIAFYVTEDWVYHRLPDDCYICDREIYWRYIPDSIVYTYSRPEISTLVKKLIREKKAYSSMRYAFDLKFNPRRQAFVWLHERRHIDKYKKYYKV